MKNAIQHQVSRHPISTLGCALSILWITCIVALSAFKFEGLIGFLEQHVSHDGLISRQVEALVRVALTPLSICLLIFSVSVMRIRLHFPERLFPAYLVFFSVTFAFHTSYKLIMFGNEDVEDNLLEWVTFGSALIASGIFALIGILRVRFALFLSVAWLFFSLEEISWGQRLFGFESPNIFRQNNYQEETNIHNFFNPYFLVLYVMFNFIVFSFLTWFRRFRALSGIYRIHGLACILKISDKFGLWLIPFVLTFASIFAGDEYVEALWGFLGLILSMLILLDRGVDDHRSYFSNMPGT